MEGDKDKSFSYTFGQVMEAQGKDEEALKAYFAAAVENYEDSKEKAQAMYARVNGNADGFEKKLEMKQRELPYHPEHFKPEREWQGKTVLIELFTGSECPPCAGADFGFDGIIESVDPRYALVLEYHLPIPRPDPMMNHATDARASYYEVRSTPSSLFDGENKLSGGGGREQGETKYNEYLAEIKNRVYDTPAVKLELKASLKDGLIQAAVKADNVLDTADYHMVLVQHEEKYGGSNGVVYHKMVVRELKSVSLNSDGAGTVIFDLAGSEKAAAEFIADFEKARSFKFPKTHEKIDPAQLRVVVLAQDKESKKVLNASYADIM